jgi:hypothetical protein
LPENIGFDIALYRSKQQVRSLPFPGKIDQGFIAGEGVVAFK